MNNVRRYLILLLVFLNFFKTNAQSIDEFKNNVNFSRKIEQKLEEKLIDYDLLFKSNDSTIADLKDTICNLLIDVVSFDINKISAFNIDSLNKHTDGKKKSQLLFVIINNCNRLLDENKALTVEAELEDHPDSLKSISERFNDNQYSFITGLRMIRGIRTKNEEMLRLFSEPLNISELSEFYNINSEVIQFLLGTSKTSKSKAEVVVKGYSPFTNIYEEFVFFADSLDSEKKSNDTIEDSLLKSRDDKLKVSIDINKDNIYLVEDSLFNKALNDSMFPHELISRYDKESLKKYWVIYRNQWEESLIIKSDEISLAQKELIPSLAQIETKDVSEKIRVDSTQPEVKSMDKDVALTSDIPKKTEEEFIRAKTITMSVDIGGIKEEVSGADQYFVQIAASRTPISNQLLKSLYNGKDSVHTREEEGWIKYQLGGGESYEEARRIKQNVKVSGAFIVAYKNNAKQLLWKTTSWRQFVQIKPKLVFVIQVSANKNKMTDDRKKSLEVKYSGQVREIEEEGWYKYQLVVGDSYNEAVKKWKQIGTKVSFVVAYYNNKKIKLSTAIKIYNENKSN